MSQTGKESQAGIQHTSMQLYLSICRALPLLEEFLGVVTEVSPPLSTTQLPCCPRGSRQLPTHPRHSGRRNEPAELGRLGQDWHSPQQAQAVGHLSQHAGATTAPIPGLKMPHPVPAHRQHQQLWGNPCLPCG